MKHDIHPAYHPNAKITCATCRSMLVTGSTVPDIRVEICSQCHPFYTGKQNLIDTAGRVDRFKRIIRRRDSTRAAQRTTTSDKRQSASAAT